jgi:hypothetical protein
MRSSGSLFAAGALEMYSSRFKRISRPHYTGVPFSRQLIGGLPLSLSTHRWKETNDYFPTCSNKLVIFQLLIYFISVLIQ